MGLSHRRDRGKGTKLQVGIEGEALERKEDSGAEPPETEQFCLSDTRR